MLVTDPIADMLTRIRNACMARHERVDIPASKMKRHIAKILKEEGYISEYKFINDGKQGILRLYLKYDENRQPVIAGLKRVSKPGCRIYVTKDELPNVRSGYGTAIISTSKGILTSKQCRRLGVGGEVLCYIW